MSRNLRRALMGASFVAFSAIACAAQAQVQDPSSEVLGLTVTAMRRAGPGTSATADAPQIDDTVNAVNVEDTVKYLPSLIVRKRHIGDTQAPLATRTSGLGASARTLIFADGVLLSALIGNNNSTASPRWAMVAPEEVESVSFLYGPFSAAYAGNSIGGVLNIKTVTPHGREGAIRLSGSSQAFGQYATDGDFGAAQVSASYGDRIGRFWFRLSGNLVESNSQPLAYITATRPANPSASGTPVTGAFVDKNRTGAPIAVFGAGGFEHQVQTNLKVKLGYETPLADLAYTVARFTNDDDADAQTYARSAAGAPVYSGTVNFGGYAYSLPVTAFSNNLYARDDLHWMQSLTAASNGSGPWSWRAAASLYDFTRDGQRTPSTALPAARDGGAGALARLDGTGWRTLDSSASRRFGDHAVSFGGHADEVELASKRNALGDWTTGPAGALTLEASGKTRTQALYGQDGIALSDHLKLTLGARYENWRAFDGFNASASPALSVSQPELKADKISPKATLEWMGSKGWSVTAAYGEAYRFPTVTELYQVITTGPTLTVPDPNLKPEHARSAELAVAKTGDNGRVRISLFAEQIDGALISQSAPLIPGSTTLFNYVQNVDRTAAYGLELAVERRDVLIRGLDLSASATWTDPTIDKDKAFSAAVGKQIPGVPKFKATAVATYRPDERLALTLAARYSARAYATIDNTDILTHTFQGFDPFFIIDARASYKIDAHWEAALGVDNLADRRYFLFHPFPGRTAMAELNYRF